MARSTAEEGVRRRQREDQLRCIDCGKQTTKIEAEDRVIRTGACGHCGGQLVGIDQCARKQRVNGRNFLCVSERGHRGEHRYNVKVKR